MAVDDFLFHSLGGLPQTFLRFYTWKRPTASLGYSQKADKVVDLNFCKQNKIDIVRRMTGGKLVLHHKEVTYSICSSDQRTFPAAVMDSYRLISEALIRGLEKMGLQARLADSPPAAYARGSLPCFSSAARHEIEIRGKKIVGSAQKRIGHRFIQHGSIPLEKEDELLKSVALLRDGGGIRMISLSQALGRPVNFDWAVGYFLSGLAEYFGAGFELKTFSPQETESISSLEKGKYANPAWTFGGPQPY